MAKTINGYVLKNDDNEYVRIISNTTPKGKVHTLSTVADLNNADVFKVARRDAEASYGVSLAAFTPVFVTVTITRVVTLHEDTILSFKP